MSLRTGGADAEAHLRSRQPVLRCQRSSSNSSGFADSRQTTANAGVQFPVLQAGLHNRLSSSSEAVLASLAEVGANVVDTPSSLAAAASCLGEPATTVHLLILRAGLPGRPSSSSEPAPIAEAGKHLLEPSTTTGSEAVKQREVAATVPHLEHRAGLLCRPASSSDSALTASDIACPNSAKLWSSPDSTAAARFEATVGSQLLMHHAGFPGRPSSSSVSGSTATTDVLVTIVELLRASPDVAVTSRWWAATGNQLSMLQAGKPNKPSSSDSSPAPCMGLTNAGMDLLELQEGLPNKSPSSESSAPPCTSQPSSASLASGEQPGDVEQNEAEREKTDAAPSGDLVLPTAATFIQ
mmetsp:Transcript_83728/g.233504  ORF Transcript_83728/g.233504 Transcript_83728/m.233504 type:complete len:353 (-) Transcript_83728:597-1655(-)